MKRHRYLAHLAAAATVAVATQASASPAGSFEWLYVADSTFESSINQGGQTFSGEEDGDGYGFRAQLMPAEMLVITTEYRTARDLDVSGGNFDQIRAGLGVPLHLQNNVVLMARAEYLEIDFAAQGSQIDDEEGFGIHADGSIALAPEFQIYGSLGFLSFSDADGPEYKIGARFMATEMVHLFADYRYSDLSFDDADANLEVKDVVLGVGLRF